jgi:hypothetical protein
VEKHTSRVHQPFSICFVPSNKNVDALKSVILGAPYAPLQIQPLVIDIAIIGIFDVVMIAMELGLLE